MTSRLWAYLRDHHVGLLALFVALGGTAYAAALPRNSVGTRQLKNNAVISSKVKAHSLLASDFRAGQLPPGPRGPKGDLGPAGPEGDPGPAAQMPANSLLVLRAARVLSTATVQTISGSQSEPADFGAELPVSGGSWTQLADETDTFAGTVAVTWPDDCYSGGDFSAVYITVLAEGKRVAEAGAETNEHPGVTQTLDLIPWRGLFEPGQDTARTLTVRVHDACNTGQHFTIGTLRMNVIATR